MQELENLITNFEFTLTLKEARFSQNNNIKQDIVSEYRSSDYNIDDLNYVLLGFKITALDIKIHVVPKKNR